LSPESIEAVAQAATRAFRERRFNDAAAGYERCVAMNPKAPAFHFNLGTAREFGGDLPGAIKAYLSAWNLDPSDGRLALFAGAALAAAGRREDAAILFSLGDDVDPAVRQAKDRPDFDSEIRRRSETADRVMRELFTNLHEDAVAEFERHLPDSGDGPPPDLSRVRRAIWALTHARPFSYRAKKQQPTLLYMPDLPATPIFARERLPWAGAVEAATEAVREEYVEALRQGAAMSPYVDPKTRAPIWHALRGNMDWSSLHLYKMAQETPLAQHFPRTLEALAGAEIVRIDGKPVELFFSRLRPGTHIPPHFGGSNNRITIHLPLIVPGECSIRVGDEFHAWREGELFAFDDSFEHEAWNHADSDRVVLIFESPHPDLSAVERQCVEFAIERRGQWLRERAVPAE